MESPKRLRVLQISHDYEGPFRTVCRQYASAFSGHQVTTLYICGQHSAAVARQTGGDQVLFMEQTRRAMRGIKIGALIKLARLFRQQSFDVVIAHRYKPIYLAGLMSFVFRIPLLLAVVHEHGVLRRLTRRLFITFWRRNIVCIGVSDSVSRDIEATCGPLASTGRLYTLPHGTDVAGESRLHSAEEARRRLNIPADAFCFGTVGRLVAKKRQDLLLKGYREYLSRNQDQEDHTLLVLMGTGPEEARLRQYVKEHGIEARVMFTGHVDDAWQYMRALDVFVLSSGIEEAFGMVLLEAMLASVPVICSDAPGPAEVVGEAALMFPAGDVPALGQCLASARRMSAQERRRLGEAGHDRLAQEYSLESFKRRLWDLPALRELAMGPQ